MVEPEKKKALSYAKFSSAEIIPIHERKTELVTALVILNPDSAFPQNVRKIGTVKEECT